MEVPSTRVRINVSCKKLKDKDTFSKSDPVCRLMQPAESGGPFVETGRTEMVKVAHMNMNMY